MGCPAYGLWPPTGIEPPNRRFSTDQLRLYTSNKQIRADMEELREFLCLVLRHSALSGKDLRHPALGDLRAFRQGSPTPGSWSRLRAKDPWGLARVVPGGTQPARAAQTSVWGTLAPRIRGSGP